MDTLYHLGFHTGSRLVRMILRDCSVDHNLIEEAFWKRRTGFLRLNPDGAVPVLQLADGQTVCGAGVISEFIAESSPKGSLARHLMMESAQDRAEMRRLLDWFCRKMDLEVTGPLARERIYKPDIVGPDHSAPDPAILRAARTNLGHHLDYVDYLAETRNWLAGMQMSFADFAAGAAISIVDYLGEINWSNRPATKAWYMQIKSRPGFQPILKERIAGFQPPSHYDDPDF